MNLEKNYLSAFGRIEPFAIISGFLISLACLYLSTSLAAVYGYWPFHFEDDLDALERYWRSASLVWVLSITVGCLFTALAGQSQLILNGVLNSLVAWACSFLFFGGISVRIADSYSDHLVVVSHAFIFWHGFMADLSGLVVAFLIGVLGPLIKRIKVEVKKEVPASSKSILNQLDPAKY